MKKLKTMALIAMCMPFLSACSGSGSEDNSLYGELPDRYEQFVKEKEQLREQAKDIKTEAEKKALIEKSEKMTETWKVKIEESAKALNGKPIKLDECGFDVTTPLSLEFTDFFSKLDLEPSFQVNGEAVAASDIKTDLKYVLGNEQVYLVGYDAEGQQVYKVSVGSIEVENADGCSLVKAGTPVKFSKIHFSSAAIKKGCRDAKTFKLEVMRQ